MLNNLTKEAYLKVIEHNGNLVLPLRRSNKIVAKIGECSTLITREYSKNVTGVRYIDIICLGKKIGTTYLEKKTVGDDISYHFEYVEAYSRID
jgi:hypothetical protein